MVEGIHNRIKHLGRKRESGERKGSNLRIQKGIPARYRGH